MHIYTQLLLNITQKYYSPKVKQEKTKCLLVLDYLRYKNIL